MDVGTAYLSNMFWVPKSKIKVDEFKKYFTLSKPVYNQAYYDYVYAYDETETHLGLPRYWAVNNIRGGSSTEIVNDTVFESIEWPRVQFSESGGYRRGQWPAILTIRDKFLLDNNLGSLLQAKCGSGKTVCSLSIAAQMNVKTLVTVHKQDLEDQWLAAANTFFPGARVGLIRQNLWDYLDKHLVVASTQTLYARRAEYPKDFLRQFGLVIYDEGHLYPAETFQYILRAFPAKFRLGISATWDRKDTLDRIWGWHVGEIDHRMDTESLTGKYKVHTWAVTVDVHKYSLHDYDMELPKLLTSLARDVPYNDWIVKKHILPAYNEGRKILVPSDRIEQLEYLYMAIRKLDKDASVGIFTNQFFGKTLSKNQQRAALDKRIILGTYKKLNEGTDVPDADTLMLISPRSDVRQIVGRIQRFWEGKKSLLIHDFVCDAGIMWAMFRKRRKHYAELGFTELKDDKFDKTFLTA